jgi:hypothetical protein
VSTQLTLDGREVPVADVTAPAPKGHAMKIVMEHLAKRGSIRSAQAGRIVHDARRKACERPTLPGAIGCCQWAASDGGEVLRRLQRRGLVVQHGGIWYLT